MSYEESSEKAAEIMRPLLRARKPVNVIDILIVSITVANGVEEILTREWISRLRHLW